MTTWDTYVLSDPLNEDFLLDLNDREPEDVVEAILDACRMVLSQDEPTAEELANGQVAATIAAIWAGAPYSAGELVEEYPFIRDLTGTVSEELSAAAAEVLEGVDTEEDVDSFLEALS